VAIRITGPARQYNTFTYHDIQGGWPEAAASLVYRGTRGIGFVYPKNRAIEIAKESAGSGHGFYDKEGVIVAVTPMAKKLSSIRPHPDADGAAKTAMIYRFLILLGLVCLAVGFFTVQAVGSRKRWRSNFIAPMPLDSIRSETRSQGRRPLRAAGRSHDSTVGVWLWKASPPEPAARRWPHSRNRNGYPAHRDSFFRPLSGIQRTTSSGSRRWMDRRSIASSPRDRGPKRHLCPGTEPKDPSPS